MFIIFTQDEQVQFPLPTSNPYEVLQDELASIFMC
jgi:hypothetical protein